MLDGSRLRLQSRSQTETLYVPRPFPACPVPPEWPVDSEKWNYPYTLWSAIHLASDASRRHTVLISITQNLERYADGFLTLLSEEWADLQLPEYFEVPSETEDLDLWARCLLACEDYFGIASREYQLLARGIVLHHGKMPGLMSRLLVHAIERRLISIVLATSTLSEGVNLPFDVVLVPSLKRWDTDTQKSKYLSSAEFSNLAGRAGRPGVGIEGRTLVILPREASTYQHRSDLQALEAIIEGCCRSSITHGSQGASSPLAKLLSAVYARWRELRPNASDQEFWSWLEQVSPLAAATRKVPLNDAAGSAIDALDGVLIAATTELEQRIGKDITATEWESKLSEIWQRSYARYASTEHEALGNIFVARGRAVVESIYPDAADRRRLYRTSLSPTGAVEMINALPRIRHIMEQGFEYSAWSQDEQFEFIYRIVQAVSEIAPFRIGKAPGGRDIGNYHVLRHWLAPKIAKFGPAKGQESRWYNFIAQSYIYRFNWGLGSVLSLVTDELHKGEVRKWSLQDWPTTGLPWCILWIKELITWGTLDPVAAAFLAKGAARTREDAEGMASAYYAARDMLGFDANELLRPANVRLWTDSAGATEMTNSRASELGTFSVRLSRDFTDAQDQFWRVIPVLQDRELVWFDIAGYELARSPLHEAVSTDSIHKYDFVLNSVQTVVETMRYL